ncbi:MAG: hypothetical protein ACLFP9_05815 [Desulfonatronovibrio sp.]
MSWRSRTQILSRFSRPHLLKARSRHFTSWTIAGIDPCRILSSSLHLLLSPGGMSLHAGLCLVLG